MEFGLIVINVSTLCAMLSTALLAGNTVILALSNNLQQAALQLASTLLSVGIPESAVQVALPDSTEWLISCATIAGLIYIGDERESFRLNKILSNRSGLLTQFIPETDLLSFDTMSDQYFILRFITERTHTINTTAVGEDATLLVLGSGD